MRLMLALLWVVAVGAPKGCLHVRQHMRVGRKFLNSSAGLSASSVYDDWRHAVTVDVRKGTSYTPAHYASAEAIQLPKQRQVCIKGDKPPTHLAALDATAKLPDSHAIALKIMHVHEPWQYGHIFPCVNNFMARVALPRRERLRQGNVTTPLTVYVPRGSRFKQTGFVELETIQQRILVGHRRGARALGPLLL